MLTYVDAHGVRKIKRRYLYAAISFAAGLAMGAIAALRF
jgi:hypothetical protein